MGQTIQTKVKFGNKTSQGDAHLESTVLTFRGDFRLSIPLKEISSVVAKEGRLVITFSEGKVIFFVGAAAEKWAEKIKHPKSLLDKLGVKSESNVAVLGVEDKYFMKDLRNRTKTMNTGKLTSELDLIFYSAESLAGLARLSFLKKHLHKTGAIWVVSQKGTNAKIKDVDVMRAARDAGLVDNKVVSFSDSHTTLKLVIPKNQRAN
jgi:hypothetical protein